MIRKIKKHIKIVYSSIFLKLKKCSYGEQIPIVAFTTMVKNRGLIIFNGYGVIEGAVLIKNNGGSIHFGNNLYIRRYTKIQNNQGKITIGSNCTINDFTIVQSGSSGIRIGDNVRIAPFVKIFAENHVFGETGIAIHEQGMSSKGIVIGNNVWIGTGAIILDGVTIGNNVVVGAGSVVTKSFECNQVIAGNPAKSMRNLYNE